MTHRGEMTCPKSHGKWEGQVGPHTDSSDGIGGYINLWHRKKKKGSMRQEVPRNKAASPMWWASCPKTWLIGRHCVKTHIQGMAFPVTEIQPGGFQEHSSTWNEGGLRFQPTLWNWACGWSQVNTFTGVLGPIDVWGGKPTWKLLKCRGQH